MSLRDSIPDRVLIERDGAHVLVLTADLTRDELARLIREQDAIYERFARCVDHGDGQRCGQRAIERGDVRNCQPRPMWHWYRAEALRLLAAERARKTLAAVP